MTESNHLTEFPAFGPLPATVAKLVADGVLADQSWHRDGCPSFVKAADAGKPIDEIKTLWVDWPNAADRETPVTKRFHVQYPSANYFLSTDDEAEAVAMLLKPSQH